MNEGNSIEVKGLGRGTVRDSYVCIKVIFCILIGSIFACTSNYKEILMTNSKELGCEYLIFDTTRTNSYCIRCINDSVYKVYRFNNAGTMYYSNKYSDHFGNSNLKETYYYAYESLGRKKWKRIKRFYDVSFNGTPIMSVREKSGKLYDYEVEGRKLVFTNFIFDGISDSTTYTILAPKPEMLDSVKVIYRIYDIDEVHKEIEEVNYEPFKTLSVPNQYSLVVIGVYYLNGSSIDSVSISSNRKQDYLNIDYWDKYYKSSGRMCDLLIKKAIKVQ